MTLRVATWNLWGATEPVDARLELAVSELLAAQVEVVCLQEVAEHRGSSTAKRIAEALGAEVAANLDDSGMLGLAVVSRRSLGPARVRALPSMVSGLSRRLLSVPLSDGGTWLHVTHLDHPLDAGVWRQRQVTAIDATIRALIGDCVHILCGDMNADPDADEMRFLRGLAAIDGRSTHYQDAWLRHHPETPGTTWCAQDAVSRATRSVDVDRRLDYIYVSTRSRDGRGTIRSCELLGERRRPDGLAASDHLGVVAEIQVATAS